MKIIASISLLTVVVGVLAFGCAASRSGAEAAFQEARAQDSVSAYYTFLSQYPYAPPQYRNEARRRMEELEAAGKAREGLEAEEKRREQEEEKRQALAPIPISTPAPQPEAPFGLRFGMSQARVKYARARSVSLNQKPDILSIDNDCYSAILSAWYINAPREFHINLDTISSAPSDLSHTAFSANSIGANFSKSGNIAAGLYSIPILSKPRKVCLGFYKNQLFLVHLGKGDNLNTDNDWDNIEESAKASLERRYGEPQEKSERLDYACVRASRAYCYRTWISENERVYIRNETNSSITYVYEPVKRPELEEIVRVYLERKGEASQSGF